MTTVFTRQYNPNAEGAPNLGVWMNAVMSMKGDSGGNMPVIHVFGTSGASPFCDHIGRAVEAVVSAAVWRSIPATST